MGSYTDSLEHVKSLLSPSEIIDPNSPDYAFESTPWAFQKNLHPKLVIRPKDAPTLSKCVAYLAKTDLDFAVRSQGYGSASAKDVLISLTAFDGFSFDREKEVVTVGAGQNWDSYYKKMEAEAPDYTIVACRTPMIGIGGSTLTGGFSWLSGEYGCASDPQNMLDAQVVKLDGSVVWAATDPDLMWALRGAGASFGIVTTIKFRAYQYPETVFAGPIMLPRNCVAEVAKGIAAFCDRVKDPKVSGFLYVLPKELMHVVDTTEDMLVVHAYDAHGEEHARRDDAFGWVFKIPGAIDGTSTRNLRGVAAMQAMLEAAKGLTISYWSPWVLSTITEGMVMRSFEWFFKVRDAGGSVGKNAYLIFELMCMNSLPDPSVTAWPRPEGSRHIILLGTGCSPDALGSEKELARKLIIEGPADILEPGSHVVTAPNTVEDFHDMDKSFGRNWARLKALKKKLDPENKLNDLPGPAAVRV